MITHSKVVLDEEDLSAVLGVLNSGQLVQGERVRSLEKALASFVGVDHGVAVSSGSAALHLSLLALGVAEGSEVILPSFVCTALLNAVRYVRAVPVLVEIDPHTYNMSPRRVEEALSEKTAAIITPHTFGLSADTDILVSFGIPVIEDCAQSLGAKLKERYTGSYGKISVFSLYATKMLCAGEGGVILSRDEVLTDRVRDLRAYDEKEDYAVRYNYKLTDMQAALAESQLRKLPSFVEKRREIAEIYNAGLSGLKTQIPLVPEGKEHAYHRYVILVDDPKRFMEAMNQKGIQCRRPIFKPLHRYLHMSGFEVTEHIWSRAVSIPIYPALSHEEAYQIVDTVRGIL
jgi:dTDP-4-amino-4,6-dideoxygalactose transaminase